MNATTELYSDIELTTEVMTASSHRLIQMLIDKCLQQVRLAKTFITEKDIHKKHKAISKAADIINYLRTCLNFDDEKARDLSNLLDSIYIFIEKSLLEASLKNDVWYLDQSETVLTILKSGWDGISG